jgi:hypothetical protein
MSSALQTLRRASASPSAAKRDLQRYIFIGLSSLLAGFSLLPIWMNTYFASQNGPEYLLFIQMLKEFSNPDYGYPEYYTLWPVIIPNLSVPFLTLLLSYAFPLLTACKLVLSLVLLLFPLSVFYFLSVVNPRNVALGVFGILYMYNYFTLKGYENYLLSISLALIFLGYYIRHREDLHWGRMWGLGALLIAVYLTHLFSFFVLCLLVPLYLLLSDAGRREYAKLGMMAIPTFLLFGHYMYVVSVSASELVGDRGAWLRYDELHWTIARYFRMSMASISETATLVVLVPVSVLLTLAGWKIWNLSREWMKDSMSWTRLAAIVKRERLLSLTIVVTIIFFLAPREIAGWPKFNERFLPFVMVLLLGSVELPAVRMLRRGLVALVAVSAIIANSILAAEVADVNRELDDYLSGIPHVEPRKTLLPVHIEESKRFKVRPLRWAFNYYNIVKGGATGSSVVQAAGRVPMKYIDAREDILPSYDVLEPEAADMQRIQQVYDYVLIWGHDEAIQKQFEQAGFEVTHAQGKLRLYANTRTNR